MGVVGVVVNGWVWSRWRERERRRTKIEGEKARGGGRNVAVVLLLWPCGRVKA